MSVADKVSTMKRTIIMCLIVVFTSLNNNCFSCAWYDGKDYPSYVSVITDGNESVK